MAYKLVLLSFIWCSPIQCFNINDVLRADITCCPPHATQSVCVDESGSTCVWFSDPNDPIVIASGGTQCIGKSWVQCKQADITAICNPIVNSKPIGPPPECGPITPQPTPLPTPACTLNVNYAFEGYPCQLSGDPHTKLWNGLSHDFQGQPETGKEQFYYIHTCSGADETQMPFNLLGRHFKWRDHAMSGLDYFTIELFDHDGDEYFVFLSSAIHSYALNAPGISTLFDNNNPSHLTSLTSNVETFIGSRFKVLYIQTSQYRIDVTLTIDSACDIHFFMQGQTNFVENRYKMHYVQIQQSQCYKCFTCGLCGNFKDRMTGQDVEQIETCNGEYIDFRPGWNAHHTPEAYDIDGWTWEKSYVKNSCASTYDITNNNGNDFEYVDACDPTIKLDVEAQCQATRNAESACCALLGSTVCDELQEDCNYDACVAAEGDSTQIAGAVADIFTAALDVACSIPDIAEQFNPGNMAQYTHLGCYADQYATRALSAQMEDIATLQECAALCSAYNYFGVEVGKECWCGNSETDAKQYGVSTSCWGDGLGGHWSFDLYEITEAPAFEIGLLVGHNPVVYPAVDIGQTRFNHLFRNSGAYIIRRDCPQCAATHQVIYYKRITNPQSFDVYSNMKLWLSVDNELGIDFNLYSTLDDAVADRNAWQWCNYDDTWAFNDAGIGAFRDCGPTERVNHNWCSTGYHGTECRFSIYNPSGSAAKEHAVYVNAVGMRADWLKFGSELMPIGCVRVLVVCILGLFVLMHFVCFWCFKRNQSNKYIPIADPIPV
eukprot:484387_1